MELRELYSNYRNAQFALVNEKILSTLDHETLFNSAKVLNMLDKNENIVFERDGDLARLMDLAVYEYKIDGKNTVERYMENHGPENEMEGKVLKALLSSYTSLFRVVNVSSSKHMVFLKDTFNKRKNIRIVDMAFSQKEDIDALVFVRILPFPELNMTSGASLVFPGNMEIFLVDNYRKIREQLMDNESANKYIWFYHLYMQYGVNIEYRDIEPNRHEHHEHNHNHDHDHHHHHL